MRVEHVLACISLDFTNAGLGIRMSYASLSPELRQLDPEDKML
jgi:hypothetical protein